MKQNQMRQFVANQREIVEMFDDIAPKYDFINHAMSLNVDKIWRKEARVLSQKNMGTHKLNIVDIACGTGDMMIEWLKMENINEIIGIDPSKNMLNIAREKIKHNSARFLQGEAKDLGAISDSFADIISVAYGLRNVVELDLALSEIARALRQNGLFVILEFTKKEKPNLLDKSALFYTTKILPLIGGAISKNYGAYKYLPDSINGFLSLENLDSKLKNLGFETLIKKRYFANLCSLIIAKKL